MNFKKPLLITAGILIGSAIVMSVNAFTIQSNLLNAVATFQQFFVTTNGFAPNGSNEILSVNSGGNGRIGIGISSPSEKFHVNGNTILSGQTIINGDGGSDYELVIPANGTKYQLFFNQDYGIFSTISTTQNTGGLRLGGGILDQQGGNLTLGMTINSNAGGNAVLRAGRQADFGGNVVLGGDAGVCGTGGNVTINGQSCSNANGNVLIANQWGNVGIGTSTPDQKLTISGGNVRIVGINASAPNQALGTDGSGNIQVKTIVGGFSTGFASSGTNLFYMSGNVGIGTGNPSSTLDVLGTLRINNGNNGSDVLNTNAGYIRMDNLLLYGGFGTFPASISIQDGGSNGGANVTINASNQTNFPGFLGGNIYLLPGNGTQFNPPTFTPIEGRVGIGTTSPDQKLSVNGNASKVGGGSWATFSDKRLKDIGLNFTRGIKELSSINPIFYNYKKDNGAGINDHEQHVGVIAQEIQKAIPEAVTTTDKGWLQVNNDPIIRTMLNAIKEQQVFIEKLEKRIEVLEKK